MKEHHPSMALRSYQAALVVAKKLRSEQHEIEVLKEITQVKNSVVGVYNIFIVLLFPC